MLTKIDLRNITAVEIGADGKTWERVTVGDQRFYGEKAKQIQVAVHKRFWNVHQVAPGALIMVEVHV